MRVIVFGASGGVGRQLVQQCAERGHSVTAVARAGSTIAAHPRVTHVVADVLAAGAFEHVRGHEAVLSALGLKRQVPANPWSRLASPLDFCSHTARLLVEAMNRHGVRRVLAVSAAGVGDSAAKLNAVMRFFVATSNVGVAYRDLHHMERVFESSGLDWCCPRPTRLTDGERTERAHAVEHFGLRATISRADVAAWMVARLQDDTLLPRTPQLTVAE
jgi:putative NADH-flavin reductase